MKIIRTRRQGSIIATIRLAEMPVARKVKTRPEYSTIPAPTRKDMPKREWFRYGELLRGIKRLVPEYQGLEYMSLQDLAEAREGIRRADMIRAIAQYK